MTKRTHSMRSVAAVMMLIFATQTRAKDFATTRTSGAQVSVDSLVNELVDRIASICFYRELQALPRHDADLDEMVLAVPRSMPLHPSHPSALLTVPRSPLRFTQRSLAVARPLHLAEISHALRRASQRLSSSLEDNINKNSPSQIANMLSLSRIAAIPIIVGVFFTSLPWRHEASAGLLALAALTDWLDGYLARHHGMATEFGAFLDPVADKLLVCSLLVTLAGTHGAVVAIPSTIIIAREIAISALRECMAQRGLRDVVAVGKIGKMKTAAQLISLFLILLAPVVAKLPLLTVGLWLLNFSALLAFISCAQYFGNAAPMLFGSGTG